MSIRRMMLFTLGAKIKNLIQVFKERVLGDLGQFEAETCLDTQLTDLDNSGVLDSASLIVTPNGYKETLLYAFEPSEVGTNLLLRSEEFENVYWSKNNSTIIPNAILSPNGEMNADKLVENNLLAEHNIQVFTSGTELRTNSIFVKAGERSRFVLWAGASGYMFDLISLTTTPGNNASGITKTLIEDYGNGWYRCSIVSAVGPNNGYRITLLDNLTSPIATSPSYLGDGVSGLYIWGAQRENVANITDYIPTTDRQIIDGTIGDMTVTRATTGTRVNSDGFIEQVPYNLLQRSEEFEQAIWTKTSLSIIQNTQTSPIGNLTADTIRIGVDASSVRHRFLQQITFPPKTTYLASYYLKKANHRWIQLTYVLADYGLNSWANFDLQDGVIGNTGAGAVATITNVGNGWYRCTLQGITNAGGALTACEIITTNNTDSGRYPPYQSTVAEDVCYVWGAQLVTGIQPKDYFPTTNRFNIPRIDYSNGSCPSILIEPLRTNLILQSEDFTNGWAVEGISITGNTQIAPDNLPSADTLSELATNDQHRTYRSAITITANTLYTASFFVKKNNVRYVRLVLLQNASTTIWTGAQFDLDTQTFTSQVGTGGGVFSSATITTFVNGWFRISVVGSIPGTSIYSMLALSDGSPMLNTNGGGCPVYLGNTSNSLYVWGGQLELGPNVTSYIPTTTATVTRNADIITNTNASTLIGQTEGSVYFEVPLNEVKGAGRVFLSFSANATNWVRFRIQTDGINTINIQSEWYVNSVFVSQANGTFSRGAAFYKILFTYGIGSQVGIFCNGVKISTTNPIITQLPLFTTIELGHRGSGSQINENVKNYAIYKTAFSDTQAINLTTL